jgi:hypothetical protein
MSRCQAPLLVLPGHDEFHPTVVSEQICEQAPDARCLPVDCREPGNLQATIDEVRRFLVERTP